MPASVTSSPSAVLPDQVLGRPIRLPFVLLCTQGERFCGKRWTANTRRELTEHMKTRRIHEQSCAGGLILATA